MAAEDYSNKYQEARQHLSLSAAARRTLEGDRQDFGGGQSWAGILNYIFAVYRDTADASVSTAVERRREQLKAMLGDVVDPAARDAVLDRLMEVCTEELARKAAAYGAVSPDPNEEDEEDEGDEKDEKKKKKKKKKKGFKFRLDMDNYAFRERWLDSSDAARYYGGRFSRYLRAVLEEYAAKTIYQREEIYFAQQLRLIRGSVADRELLCVELRNGHTFDVRPYGVLSDQQETYHYLVGIACPTNDRTAERIACFRLSKLAKLRPSAKRSGRLTKEESDAIEARIRDVGVQFLTQQKEKICIRLTEDGRRSYEQQMHLRPAAKEKKPVSDGAYCWEYTFSCTEFRAEAYFLKFCGDAKVVAPQSLQNRFVDKYRSGLNAYQTPDTQGRA